MKRREKEPQELNMIQTSWIVDSEGVVRWKRNGRAGVKAGDPVATSIKSTGHKTVFLQFEGKLRSYSYGPVCWFLFTGLWPNKEIDHIDRNPQNNKRENLRQADRSQNTANRVVQNKCGHQGIYLRKSGKYSAQVWREGKAINLGTFNTAEEAALARAKAARSVHGEFAVIM